MNLNKTIETRQSIRKYKDKKPNWRAIIEAVDMARHAPMAGGQFSMKFIIVDDEKKINSIATSSQQDFISQAKYLIIACTNSSRTINEFGKDGEKYCHQQAGAAIQNILLKLNERGLSSCWVGYFIEKDVKSILKIPEKTNIEAIIPVGYANEKKRIKRIELDNILYFNEFGKKKMREQTNVRA